ncbi:hypothetical protein GEMRC1_001664 [Eukaryota sp. GEM-RC1]
MWRVPSLILIAIILGRSYPMHMEMFHLVQFHLVIMTYNLEADGYNFMYQENLSILEDIFEIKFIEPKLFSLSGTFIPKYYPIPGVKVYIDNADEPVISNDEGKFVIPHVRTGKHQLRFQHNNYALEESVVDPEVDGNALGDIQLVPKSYGTDPNVFGFVVDSYGNPLDSVTVSVGNKRLAKSDFSGFFSFHLDNGLFKIKLRLNDMVDEFSVVVGSSNLHLLRKLETGQV